MHVYFHFQDTSQRVENNCTFLFLFSGHISLRADVYTPYRNIVNHITPFTTWVMTVAEERSEDIDVSKVTHIRMQLDGSAVNAVTLAQCTEAEPCPQAMTADLQAPMPH